MDRHAFSIDPAVVEHLGSIIANGEIDQRHRLLGEGLSGKVYEFENYAVKVFKPDYSEKEDADLLTRLSGHAAFPALHYKEDQFMIVDKVSGYTLGQALKAGEKLNERLFNQIEEAVERCYAEGIIPDDLHLNNIMVNQDGQVKIVDVGRFFHTNQAVAHKEKLTDDLEALKYYCGLFGFFSSSKRKRRRRYSSSDYHRHRGHSYSSSHRRRYSSSDRHYRRKRYSS
ncbi:protein kinase domain-containing protein [Laceyella putida]|uniref:Protein kinase domain-containing protein n=1 Tax=Laceyella putida TaxID=110101 RepID=A0ABW2RKQ0_9BACL